MQNYLNKPRIQISSAACVFLALAVLLLPLQWVFAAMTAAIFHELCHLAALRICGERICKLQVGGNGAIIDTFSLSQGKELFCALAGPLGGLLLLFFVHRIPRIAICAAFQSVYNLLPVYPLDGGRAIRCAAELLWPLQAEKICRWIQNISLTAIVILAAYAALFLKLGLFPVFLAGLLFLRVQTARQK